MLAAIILPLINSFSDPKQLVKGAVGLGALVVVFFIGYALAGNEVTAVYTKYGVDASCVKINWRGIDHHVCIFCC